MNIPWSRLHLDFTGRLNRVCYTVVGDNYTKRLEILKYRRPTTTIAINFLHEIFSRFGIPDCIVLANGTQFTSSELKFFSKSLQIQHIRIPSVSPKIERIMECFDTFKRVLKKSEGEESDQKMLQQFLSIITIMLNLNTRSGMLLGKLMFARKIKSVFNKIIPERKMQIRRNIPMNFNPGEKVFFRMY